METHKAIRVIYTLFLGIVIALFVGIGAETLYQSPKYPEYPNLEYNQNGELSKEDKAAKNTYNKEFKKYEDKSEAYQRNISAVTMATSVALLTFSLLLTKKIKIIADGVMFAGLFTLIYALGRALFAGNKTYTLSVAAVAVLITLLLGYQRFVRGEKQRKS